MSKTKPSPKLEAQVEKTMHLTYINTLFWGLRLCLFLYSPLPFFGSVLNVSYLLVFNMAREKEQEEVRPRLRESRSVHVLTPHTCQVCTTFPQPGCARHSCTALHTVGLAAARAEGASSGYKCKGISEPCLALGVSTSFPFPNSTVATSRHPRF